MFVLSTIDRLKDVNCVRVCNDVSFFQGEILEGLFDLNYIFNLMTVFVVIIVWKRLADENLMKPFARMYIICGIRFDVGHFGFICSLRI